jgi:hypothetical protein
MQQPKQVLQRFLFLIKQEDVSAISLRLNLFKVSEIINKLFFENAMPEFIFVANQNLF